MVFGKLDRNMQTNETRPLAYNTQNLKQIRHLNERSETKNLLEQIIGGMHLATGLGNNFFYFDTKSKDY